MVCKKCRNLCKCDSPSSPTLCPALGAPILQTVLQGQEPSTKVPSAKKRLLGRGKCEKSFYLDSGSPEPHSDAGSKFLSATKINTNSGTVQLKKLFCNSYSSLWFQHAVREVTQARRNQNRCGLHLCLQTLRMGNSTKPTMRRDKPLKGAEGRTGFVSAGRRLEVPHEI